MADNTQLSEFIDRYSQRKMYRDCNPCAVSETIKAYRKVLGENSDKLKTPQDITNFKDIINSYNHTFRFGRWIYHFITVAYIVGFILILTTNYQHCQYQDVQITGINYVFKGNDSYVYDSLLFSGCEADFQGQHQVSEFGIVGYNHVYEVGQFTKIYTCDSDCYLDDHMYKNYEGHAFVAKLIYGLIASMFSLVFAVYPTLLIIYHDIYFYKLKVRANNAYLQF